METRMLEPPAGGPLSRLLRRVHLPGDDSTSPQNSLTLIGIIVALVWLPLQALTTLQGQAFGANVSVPFLRDVGVHARLLFALPLLIIAEFEVWRRMRPLLTQFNEKNLVPQNEIPRLKAAVRSAYRLYDSTPAEVLLIVMVYGVGMPWILRKYAASNIATWIATPSADGAKLSLAGIWYCSVSLPVFQFLLCRWYYRLFIWTRFLKQVSRIKLNLIPTHPDGVGGLGFLSDITSAFTALAAAHGVLLVGWLATRFELHLSFFVENKIEIALVVMFVLCITLGPLLVFSPQLLRAKQMGLDEYGTLASRYVGGFDAKWLRGGARADESLMGSPDLQSLADIGNSFTLVQTMRIALITRNLLLQITIATLLPVVPLALVVMPLDEFLKRLAVILF